MRSTGPGEGRHPELDSGSLSCEGFGPNGMLKQVQHDGAAAGGGGGEAIWVRVVNGVSVWLTDVILDLIQDLFHRWVSGGSLKQVQHDARGRAVVA